MKTLGQIAFDTHRSVFPKGSVMWNVIGGWSDQTVRSQEGWEAAAQAVKAECDKQLETYRKINAPVTGEPNDTP